MLRLLLFTFSAGVEGNFCDDNIVVSFVSANQLWSVQKGSTNVSCIVMSSNPSLTVVFQKGNSTETETSTVVINSTVSVGGKCDATHDEQASQFIVAQFYPNGVDGSTAQPWNLTIYFGKTNETFQIIDYLLSTTPSSAVPSAVSRVFLKRANTTVPDVAAGGSDAFKCSTTSLLLEDDSKIVLNDFKVVAFASIEGSDFPSGQQYKQCSGDSNTPDIVPIIVGACLAGLVVVVLVAYLIGRARARRQGYASV